MSHRRLSPDQFPEWVAPAPPADWTDMGDGKGRPHVPLPDSSTTGILTYRGSDDKGRRVYGLGKANTNIARRMLAASVPFRPSAPENRN